MARHLVRECPKAKGGGKNNGKVNSVYEEHCDGDQHADSAAVSEVTHDGHWIMVLEREAPQADLSKERGFDVCAVTLRTGLWTSPDVICSLRHPSAGTAKCKPGESDV